MNIKKTKKIFREMINILPKEGNFSNYAFLCSKEYKSNLNKYKGFKIYYLNIIKDDKIYLTRC